MGSPEARALLTAVEQELDLFPKSSKLWCVDVATVLLDSCCTLPFVRMLVPDARSDISAQCAQRTAC